MIPPSSIVLKRCIFSGSVEEYYEHSEKINNDIWRVHQHLSNSSKAGKLPEGAGDSLMHRLLFSL